MKKVVASQRLMAIVSRIWLFVNMVMVLVGTPALAAQMDREDELDRLDQAGAYYWNGMGSNGICASGASEVAGNLDYAGREILTAAQRAEVEKNQKIYEEVGEEFGLPWAVLAVLHLRETGLGRTNPGNGFGLYQITGANYTAGAKVDDVGLASQTRDAAKFLQGKISAEGIAAGLASGDAAAVKRLFFAYNGKAPAYKEQALALGFTATEAENGEGSPYVMNGADEQRDPRVNGQYWGQIKRDHGVIEYPANLDYGAYVVYASLAGENVGCGLTEGGLDEMAARQLMMNYGENRSGDSVMNMNKGARPGTTCAGGALSNCVSFSAFFLGKFTNALYVGGNGEDVVRRMAGTGVPTGSEPRVFAVFSYSDGRAGGHTGIILGIHGDQVIVGHASCSMSRTGRGDGTRAGGGAGWIEVGNINDSRVWLGEVPTEFAYPMSIDTGLMQDYVQNGT